MPRGVQEVLSRFATEERTLTFDEYCVVMGNKPSLTSVHRILSYALNYTLYKNLYDIFATSRHHGQQAQPHLGPQNVVDSPLL